MFLSVLIAVVVTAIVFAVYQMIRFPGFRVSRSIIIAAPRSAVFAHVNDLRNWNSWLPWSNLDPDAEVHFAGSTTGRGATLGWSGNAQAGTGNITILDSVANESIRISLEFVRPHPGVTTTEFVFSDADDQCRVTWTISGKNNLAARLFALYINLDKTVGGPIEDGLAMLKNALEMRS
jgi:hypothetical protein